MPTGTSDGQYYESDLHQLFNMPVEAPSSPAGASKLKTGTGVANEKERTSEAPIIKPQQFERSKELDDFIKEMDNKDLEEILTKYGYYKDPDHFLTPLSPNPSEMVDNRLAKPYKDLTEEEKADLSKKNSEYWRRGSELNKKDSEDPMAIEAGINNIGKEFKHFTDEKVPLPKPRPKLKTPTS
jgi:hypothetical protein